MTENFLTAGAARTALTRPLSRSWDPSRIPICSPAFRANGSESFHCDTKDRMTRSPWLGALNLRGAATLDEEAAGLLVRLQFIRRCTARCRYATLLGGYLDRALGFM